MRSVDKFPDMKLHYPDSSSMLQLYLLRLAFNGTFLYSTLCTLALYARKPQKRQDVLWGRLRERAKYPFKDFPGAVS